MKSDATNGVALAKGIATLREVLESRWTSVATVPGENVGVYAMGDASGENWRDWPCSSMTAEMR